MSPGPLPPQVVIALKAGNKVEAIKQLRLATGLGLKEAQDWVDAYERGGMPSAAPHRAGTASTYRVPIEAVNALKDGRAIEAIRIIRASGNFGLAEARHMVDQLQRQGVPLHRARGVKGLSPGEMPRAEGAGKLLVVAVLVAVVVFAVLHWR